MLKQEKTAFEAKQNDAERMVRVLHRCATNTDHAPGDIIPFAGPINPNIMRELTEEEREEVEAKIAARSFERGDVIEAQSVSTSVRSEIVLQALSFLKPEDDNDWLESGKPAMSAVNRELLKMGATPDTVSRAELLTIAPAFMRPTNGPSDVIGEPAGMAPVAFDVRE